jgi:hypothetical protein
VLSDQIRPGPRDRSRQMRAHELRLTPAIVWLLPLAAMILILASPTLLRTGHGASRETVVAQALREYVRDGLAVTPRSSSGELRFQLPRQVLRYSGQRSIGDVLDDVEKVRAAGLSSVQASYTFEQFVEHVGSTFAKQTAFAGRAQVNRPPRPGWINIYFLSDDPRGLAPYFSGNCSYIGYQNAILCDVRFVSSYLQSLERLDQVYDTMVEEFGKGGINGFSVSLTAHLPEIRRYLQQSFLIWLIGHEVAHAVLHRDQVVRDGSAKHFDLIYDERERQADTFVAHEVVADAALAPNFKVLLGEFIQQEFRRVYWQQHGPRPDSLSVQADRALLSQPLLVQYDRYHVPILLRSLRVMQAIYAQAPDINETAYYAVMDSGVVVVDAIAPGSLYNSVARQVTVVAGTSTWPYLVPAAGVALALLAAAGAYFALRHPSSQNPIRRGA